MGLRLLTVARTLPPHIRGGMEEASWNLARALARKGSEVTIVTTAFDDRPHTWEQDGVVVHEIAYVPRRLRDRPRYRWWPYFARAASRFAQAAGLAPDLVHSHSAYLAGFLKEDIRPPLVATIHGTPMGDYLGGAREKLIKQVGRAHPRVVVSRLAVSVATWRVASQLRQIDRIVAVSRFVADMLPGIPPDDPRVSIIPNGIDPDQFPMVDTSHARRALGLPEDESILLFLGRVEEYKGVRSLVDALARFKGARLVVAGEGPFLDPLRAHLRGHPAADRVQILGKVPDTMRPVLYAAANLFCLPSTYEGQPITLLEALAMGTPVATTKAWLPEELHPYAAINPNLERMLEQGLALSERLDRSHIREAILTQFTWDQVAQRYLTLFQSLLDEST